MPDLSTWAEFRQLMPVAQKWAYFDHAAVAPLCQPAQAALQTWLSQATEEGDVPWPGWSAGVEETRRQVALLLNTSPADVALVPNTTTAISYVAEGFPWQLGDNVVFPGGEFPSNQYPWLNLASRGVEPRRVSLAGPSLPLDTLFAACDAHTRLIAVSWVDYATGWRTNVNELVERAHARGIWVLLDAIQGLGVFPLNVQATPVDFLAADGHKWMLGPEGAGLMYIRPEHLNRLRTFNVGWNSVRHAHDFSRIELQLKPSAARWEGGSQNMAGFLALGASLKMLQHFGAGPNASRVADRVLEFTDLACEELRSAGAAIASDRAPPHRSGIVAFDWPGADLPAARRALLAAGVVVSVRGGHLRISPHAYANTDDLARLIDALKRI